MVQEAKWISVILYVFLCLCYFGIKGFTTDGNNSRSLLLSYVALFLSEGQFRKHFPPSGVSLFENLKVFVVML